MIDYYFSHMRFARVLGVASIALAGVLAGPVTGALAQEAPDQPPDGQAGAEQGGGAEPAPGAGSPFGAAPSGMAGMAGVAGNAPADGPEAGQPRAWKITPRAEIDESITDNALLTPGDHKADLISAFTAGMNVNGQSRRLQLWLDGSGTYDKYLSQSVLDGFMYNFNGNANAEVFERWLFLDLRSEIDQEALTPYGQTSAIARTQSSNQMQTFNNSVSPYIRHEFGDWGGGELRYRVSATDFTGMNYGPGTPLPAGYPPALAANFQIPDSALTNEALVNLHSGSNLERLRLSLDGDANNTSFPGGREIHQRTGTFSTDYSIIREVAVIGRVGYDSYGDNLASSLDTANPSWRLGTRLTPGPRTTLTFEAGQRYGGPYWSGTFDYKISSTLHLTASHDMEVTNQPLAMSGTLNGLVRNAQGQLVDPLTGLPVVANQSLFAYQNQSFLAKTSQVTLSGERGVNSGAVILSYQVRDIGAVSQQQSPIETQSVAALDLKVAHKVTTQATFSADINVARNWDTIPQAGDTIVQGSIGYNYKFSPSLQGTASISHYQMTNTLGTGYRENVAMVGLRKEF